MCVDVSGTQCSPTLPLQAATQTTATTQGERRATGIIRYHDDPGGDLRCARVDSAVSVNLSFFPDPFTNSLKATRARKRSLQRDTPGLDKGQWTARCPDDCQTTPRRPSSPSMPAVVETASQHLRTRLRTGTLSVRRVLHLVSLSRRIAVRHNRERARPKRPEIAFALEDNRHRPS